MKTERIPRPHFWSSKSEQVSLVSSLDKPCADLLLFHGGGWVGGSPQMLAWLAPLVAKYDVRLLLPSYRLLDQDDTSIDDAISDALIATEWFVSRRNRAKKLFIGGASSGGLLALHGVKKRHFDFSGIILMNPVVNTGENGFRNRQVGSKGRPDISPLSFIRELPKLPTLIIHPRDDIVVPIAQSENFLQDWGNPNANIIKWPERGGHGSFGLPKNRKNTHKIISEFIMNL
jgi:acetyl esterase/lipase